MSEYQLEDSVVFELEDGESYSLEDTVGPEITSQPESTEVHVGYDGFFAVSALGTGVISYQWHRSDTGVIVGAVSDTYDFTPTIDDNGITFWVVVTDDNGTATSDAATLTVIQDSIPGEVEDVLVLDTYRNWVSIMGKPGPPGKPGKPTGEANTTSNVGGGVGLALPKTGVVLPFKTLLAGAGIALTPDSQTVTIEAIATAAQNVAKILAGWHPGWRLIIDMTAQSNGGHGNIVVTDALYLAGATAAGVDFLDWSTDAAGTAPYAWREIDTTEHYDYTTADDIYTGSPRMVEAPVGSGNWYTAATVGSAFGFYLGYYSGISIGLISTARHNTGLEDPLYGWLWDESVDNLANQHADQVHAALTQLAIDDDTQVGNDYVHISIFAGGETTALTNDVPSGEFAGYLCDYMQGTEDPTKWGFCNEKTIHVLMEHGEEIRQDHPICNGIQTAKKFFGDRAIVMSAINMPTYDRVHYFGEPCVRRGDLLAQMFTGTVAQSPDVEAAFTARKDVTTLSGSYAYQAPGAGPPTSGQIIYNVGLSTVSIHHTDAGSVDQGALGLGRYVAGVVLKLAKTSAPANYDEITLDGPPTDNGTYFTWDVSVSHVGTLTPGDACTLTSTTRLWDGASTTLVADLPLSSSAYEVGSEDPTVDNSLRRRVAVFNSVGDLVPSIQAEQVRIEGISTGATANFLPFVGKFLLEAGSSGTIRLLFQHAYVSGGTTFQGKFLYTATFKHVAGVPTIVNYPIAHMIDNELNIASPYVGLIGVFGQLVPSVNGVAATNIPWVITGDVIYD